MKLISWPALAITVVYAAVIYALLTDPQGNGFAWIFFGFPGILFAPRWGGVAINVVLVYVIFGYLLPGLIRSWRKYSRPPQ